ncbi:unnamed protein product [Allacma fusca]|uniref:ATPase AAA-type core domain-containing protein n=1 Tax=Allacma fusca TaxID=39272 RepID=A0A8J2P871_9HEXA|nr:unnamed protein product [Allacma fusca]
MSKEKGECLHIRNNILGKLVRADDEMLQVLEQPMQLSAVYFKKKDFTKCRKLMMEVDKYMTMHRKAIVNSESANQKAEDKIQFQPVTPTGSISYKDIVGMDASELKSKWHGESEKLVHGLFEQLRKNKVSVLFLDEVGSVTSERNQQDGMSTFKTQLLVEMSGISSRTHDGVILVLAATNLHMNIDPAFLSRFSYRLHIKPPNDEQRLQIIQTECSKHGIELLQINLHCRNI